jgi:hypothetical protein
VHGATSRASQYDDGELDDDKDDCDLRILGMYFKRFRNSVDLGRIKEEDTAALSRPTNTRDLDYDERTIN